MIFSYNWLQDYIKEKLPQPKKLAEILSLHAFEVEEVEKKQKDWALDIDVLPNRPDCFSHLGIAKEISAITGLAYRDPTPAAAKNYRDPTPAAKDFVKIDVENSKDCPRYTAKVITGVDVGPSPGSIKQRLQTCGLQSINNIVDIANYVMLETGQPLHAFDFDKIKSENSKSKAKKIIVRMADKKEEIITLDREKYNLERDILIIADKHGPLAIAGIKGGERAGIDKNTKNIVLESANFNPLVIRDGSRKLGLRTDASFRFEHGLDPNLTEKAIDRAALLIKQTAGGNIAEGLVDFYPKKIGPKKISLDLDNIEKLLGVKVPKAFIKKTLKSLGMEVREKTFSKIEVEAPNIRGDISISQDLIEELGRIYGYDKIKPVFPTIALSPPQKNPELLWRARCKDQLKECGFCEVYNYSFISEKDKHIFNYSEKSLLGLENPLSAEQKYLRPNLIINLLKNVKSNQKNFSQIKIFELGKVFLPGSSKKELVKEKNMLSCLISGVDNGFLRLKGITDVLLKSLGISSVWYDSVMPTPEQSKACFWDLKRAAEIKTDNQELGFLGAVSRKILAQNKIKKDVFAIEIDLEPLTKLCSEEREYEPVCAFPAAIRDLSILVPRATRVAQVLNKIEQGGSALVRDVDLFDIYEAEEAPDQKKSLAFHIIYQAKDHTLTSEEINKIHNKIVRTLEKESEWEVRK